MRMKAKSVLGALLTLVVCACQSTPPPATAIDTSTTKRVTGGSVVGFVDPATGVHVWRGIPFAAPPIGDLRWRAPRAVPNWEGVRRTVDHAPWCPQIRSALDDGSSADSVPLGDIMGQEDCLYLNVYAPANAVGQDLPVMMWIHGGSNTWGRAEQYNPSRLVADENVIVVVAQYRLGPLGWFAHSSIRAHADIPEDRSANFGTLDQIAALKWIRENAAVFGGSPKNVTIFGESAGGHNVAALLVSPLAKGLFHQAIIQSGSFNSVTWDFAETDSDQSGGRIMATKSSGAKSSKEATEDYRAISVADLFSLYRIGDGESDFAPPRIIQDGVVLPEMPLRDAFNSPSTFNAVPVITGSNKDETKLWNILDERLVKWRFGLIPIARDKKFYNSVSKYPSRMWRASAVDGPAANMVAGGHEDVWTYHFEWDEGRKYLGADFAHLFGAAHSLEIPFVMGDFKFLGDADKYIFTPQNEPGRLQLSSAMMRYWANFARSGDPGGVWQRWMQDGENILVLDSPAGGGVRMLADQETEARIVADLNSDASVTETERCLIFTAMRYWAEDQDGIVPKACTQPERAP